MSRPDNNSRPSDNWSRTPSPPPDLTHLLAEGTSGTQSLTIIGIFPELLRTFSRLNHWMVVSIYQDRQTSMN